MVGQETSWPYETWWGSLEVAVVTWRQPIVHYQSSGDGGVNLEFGMVFTGRGEYITTIWSLMFTLKALVALNLGIKALLIKKQKQKQEQV